MDGRTDRRTGGGRGEQQTVCRRDAQRRGKKRFKKKGYSKNISLPDGVQKFYDTFSLLHFILTTPSTACLLNKGSVLLP